MLDERRRKARGVWAGLDIERQQGEAFSEGKRQLTIVNNLGLAARGLRRELTRTRETIKEVGPFEAPEGSAVLVEFPKNAWGIEVMGEATEEDTEGDEIKPVYEKTDMKWWNQAGVYGAAMPVDSDIRLDDEGNVAFVGNTIELDDKTSSQYNYPVFYVYNADRSMRVLHGIGWTEVSLEPLEEIEKVYNQQPEGVPTQLAYLAEKLSPRPSLITKERMDTDS